MSVGKMFARLFGFQSIPAEQGTTITLSDRDRQFQVILDLGLPDDAYHQLFHLDLSLVPPGVLAWDSRSGVWRPNGLS
ncbi:hypothetical protein BH24CHL1_BH24CHL1_11750 [soil metagenome]